MKRLAVAVLSSVLVLACQDTRTLTAPPPGGAVPAGGIVAAISDGAHGGGNPHVYFLPPLAPKPDLHERDGHRSHRDLALSAFNPRLKPVVRVLPLPAPTPGCDLASAPVYERGAALDRRGEHYDVDWDTRASRLVPGGTYRVCVYSTVGGQMLGFLDVLPISRGMKAPRVRDTYVFQDDQTVPIKVRIEMGALCAPDALECGAVGAVTSAGGTVTLPSAHAGVAIPPGAIRSGDAVTIVVAQEAPRYPAPGGGSACLPGDLTQSHGCYHFSTEPANYAFLTPVRVEACVDTTGLTANEQDQLVLFKYNAVDGLVQLPWAAPTMLDCTGFVALNGDAAGARNGFAGALWQGARRLFADVVGPRPLYAATLFGTPKGLGGLAGSFSDVGGAVPPAEGLPDLVITDAPTMYPNPMGWGDTALVWVTVRNIGPVGTGATPFQVRLTFYRSSDSAFVQSSYSGDITLLGAGGSQVITFQVPRCNALLSLGSNLYVKAEANVGETIIDEADTANNTSPKTSVSVVLGIGGSEACTIP
jgi:hypothetical protein